MGNPYTNLTYDHRGIESLIFSPTESYLVKLSKDLF